MTPTASFSRRGILSRLEDPRTGRLREPVWLGASSLLTGAATYVVLVVIARAIGPVSYADFAVFWSFMVIASFGVFLPVEQEVARRTAAKRPGADHIGRRALLLSAGYAVALLTIGTLLWRILLVRVPTETSSVIALVILCFALAAQFAARGVLSGTARLRAYATVVSVDSVVRLAVVLALASAGVRSVGAYALAVSLSALAAASVAWLFVVRGSGPSSRNQSGTDRTSLISRTGGLIVGALSMQLLLNSGPLIARGVAENDNTILAGQLLAAMTLARVPVFVFQSLQASYLARITRQSHLDDHRHLRRTLAILGALVLAVAVLTTTIAAVAGPLVTQIVYGANYRITTQAAVLVALGVSVYVLASVANDASVALGLHVRVALSWLGALAVGVLTLSLTASLLAKSTLPLVFAAAAAAVSLVWGVVRSSRKVTA